MHGAVFYFFILFTEIRFLDLIIGKRSYDPASPAMLPMMFPFIRPVSALL